MTTPDASIDIVLASNEAFDGVFVCGPLRAYSRRVLKGGVRLIGVSLRPGAGALIGVSADQLPSDWIELDALQLSGARVSPGAGLKGLFQLIEARAAKAKSDGASPRRSPAWVEAEGPRVSLRSHAKLRLAKGR